MTSKQKQHRWKEAIACAALAACTATGAFAQDGAERGAPSRPAPSGGASDGGPGQVAADLGTGWNILAISAAAFQPRGSTTNLAYWADGYVYAPSATNFLWAAVNLPSGAGIGYLDLFAYDAGADTIDATLRIYTGFGTHATCVFFLCPPNTPPAFTDVVSVQSVGNSLGYQYVPSSLLSPLHTVNNNTVYGGGGIYSVVVTLPATSTYRFKGVDVWWKRQIKPGPGTASFNDVPMGAQFFAEVEAMKAAGITAGCGDGSNYCPEDPVTRRQMAAFLARAMGLYWGY